MDTSHTEQTEQTEQIEKTIDPKTLTFTARNIEDPNRLATFTLQNGNVAVQLGEALVEQVESALETLDEEQQSTVRSWLKPAATGATQAVINPIPVEDFNANMTPEGDFRTTAWVRARGLRLAPISINWEQVDNPEGAAAFVEELDRRREVTTTSKSLNPFDYWATWLLIVAVVITVPFILWRYFSDQKQE